MFGFVFGFQFESWKRGWDWGKELVWGELSVRVAGFGLQIVLVGL